EGDSLVSFASFAERDSIEDDSLSPWIGFVCTFPQYRGHRYMGRLIGHCEKIAAEHGVKAVYICTDHVGLYEKYGFSYTESRNDTNPSLNYGIQPPQKPYMKVFAAASSP
ncbi:MAG: GNAT family N-acetyltransferase, partial [Ruminococcus sp.]|nr:GNAT family N-acetyltransferase [Ruminococcus sp.]